MITLEEIRNIDAEDQSPEFQSLTTKSFVKVELKTMRKLLYLKESNLFLRIWKNASAQEVSRLQDGDDRKRITFAQFHDEILPFVFERYETIRHDLISGEITFETIDRYFKVYKSQNLTYDQLSKDLTTFNNTILEDWIIERVDQIKMYHKLHIFVEAAQAIRDAKDTLEMIGDFSQLDVFLTSVICYFNI